MFNRIILVGNTTKDPDHRVTPGGTSVATISLACNSRFKSGNETKEETLFIDVVVWGKQADNAKQYIKKGRSLLVEGRLCERRWEYEGQKKSKMEVVATNVRYLGGGKDSSGSDGANDTPPEISDMEPF